MSSHLTADAKILGEDEADNLEDGCQQNNSPKPHKIDKQTNKKTIEVYFYHV